MCSSCCLCVWVVGPVLPEREYGGESQPRQSASNEHIAISCGARYRHLLAGWTGTGIGDMSSQAGGAIWTIQCDKGVPSSLAVSAEVLELTRRQYGGVSFKEELEVVSAQAEREEQQQSVTTPRSHSDGALNLNEGAGSVTAATKVAAASSAVATAEVDASTSSREIFMRPESLETA